VVWANLLDIASTNLSDPLYGPTGAFFLSTLGELPVSGSRDETKFSPEVKLVWDANDDTMLYLSWSEGFKSGSFDFRANNKGLAADMPASFEFDDEEASNIELGGKFVFAGGSFELNAAAFFTEYDNLQISIFDGGLGFNVGNAASAEIDGLEFDVRWAVNDYTTVTGGFAFTDFEFTDFANGQCYFGRAPDSTQNGIPRCDYTGNSNQMVSDKQGNVTVNYERPVGDGLVFSSMFDIFFTSDYDASATYDPALVQNKYSILSLRAGIGSESGNWQLALLAKNLTDEKILSFGGDTPLSGSTFGAKSNYAFYSPGRTLSAQVIFRF
jgi:outer membrane receptor protein involved in Fe transport